MFEHSYTDNNFLRFSRLDPTHPFTTLGRKFVLEEAQWPSAEHYVAAQLLRSAQDQRTLLSRIPAEKAQKWATAFWRKRVSDWQTRRRILMTRALWTLTHTYPDIQQALLDSGEQTLVETSLYDHYWGIGRDQRGENMAGRVWMDVRAKWREVSVEQNNGEG